MRGSAAPSTPRSLRAFWQTIATRNPALGMLAALLLLPAASAEPEYRHGISLVHEMKYPPDFTHFEYADPDAPKGGRIVLSTTGNIVNLSGQHRARKSPTPRVSAAPRNDYSSVPATSCVGSTAGWSRAWLFPRTGRLSC